MGGGGQVNKNIILFTGFVYGLAPTVPTFPFGFASLPYLLAAIILFYRSSKPIYFLALMLYPALSELSFFGIIICGYLVLFFAADWFINKKANWNILLAVLALSIGYIITEYRLLHAILFGGPTIRAEFFAEHSGLRQMLSESFRAFVYGHYHSGSLHTYIVLPVCMIYFTAVNIKYIYSGKYSVIFSDKYNWLIFMIFLNALIYGLDSTRYLRDTFGLAVPFLKQIQFARTLWLNPFLWYLSFMIVLCRIKFAWIKNALCIAALLAVCLCPSAYNSVRMNLSTCYNKIVRGVRVNNLTYEEFYSEKLFDQIKKAINYNGEWSIAFGMHPAVINYNGIATLDGYCSYYPLSYKKKFRRLIEPELNIDERNRLYFDNWGGRAYIFSNEVSYEPVVKLNKDSAKLNIDLDIFKNMNGKYIFSRVSISNAGELGIKSLGVYSSPDSPYIIYLYSI